MRYFLICSLLFLSMGCLPDKPSNAIDALAEKVIEKREGVEIRVTPIDNQSAVKK